MAILAVGAASTVCFVAMFAIIVGGALAIRQARHLRDIGNALMVGDSCGVIPAARKLTAWWDPVAWIIRIKVCGLTDMALAMSYLDIGRTDLAVACCRRAALLWRVGAISRLGLGKLVASSRSRVHRARGLVQASIGDADSMERSMLVVDACATDPPQDVAAWRAACYYSVGRLGEALHVVAELLKTQPAPSLEVHVRAMQVLSDLGRMEEVCRLVDPILTGQNRVRVQDEMLAYLNDDETRGGLHTTLMRTYRLGLIAHSIAVGGEAACRLRDAERHEACATLLGSFAELGPWSRANAAIVRLKGAALEGNPDAYHENATALAAIVAEHPAHLGLQESRCHAVLCAAVTAGRFEEALDALAELPEVPRTPIRRSEALAMAATAMEALGRGSEAASSREEALALAPMASWNRPADDQLASGVDDTVSAWVYGPVERYGYFAVT